MALHCTGEQKNEGLFFKKREEATKKRKRALFHIVLESFSGLKREPSSQGS